MSFARVNPDLKTVCRSYQVILPWRPIFAKRLKSVVRVWRDINKAAESDGFVRSIWNEWRSLIHAFVALAPHGSWGKNDRLWIVVVLGNVSNASHYILASVSLQDPPFPEATLVRES